MEKCVARSSAPLSAICIFQSDSCSSAAMCYLCVSERAQQIASERWTGGGAEKATDYQDRQKKTLNQYSVCVHVTVH